MFAFSVHEPLIHGKDVLALGIEPGPIVGQLLAEVESKIEDSPVTLDREQALVLLRDEVTRHLQGRDGGAR